MPTLNSGQKTNVLIQPGNYLIAKTDTIGQATIWKIGGQDTLIASMVQAQSKQIGPFASLTSIRIECAEGYLAWKWNRVVDLPPSHPNKNAAPTYGAAMSVAL